MPLSGDPDALLAASRGLDTAATGLTTVYESLLSRRRSLTGTWTGQTATIALAKLDGDARQIQRNADVVQAAVVPLATYAEELRTAQRDYARGEQMVLAAQWNHAGTGSGAVPAADAVREAANQARRDATKLMGDAEERALAANEVAARALEQAGVDLGITPPGGSRGGSSFLADVGNAAASLGNAALRNPLDGLAVVGGGALVAVGAVGAVGSLALDLTGVGAIGGLPLGAASAAAIAGGVGIAGAGLLDIARHATTDNRVAPFQVDQKGKRLEGPAPFPPPTEITGNTEHGEEQAESRNGGHGVSDAAMNDAVTNPIEEPWFDVKKGTYQYLGRDALVTLNKEGRTVTTWPRTRNGYRHP